MKTRPLVLLGTLLFLACSPPEEKVAENGSTSDSENKTVIEEVFYPNSELKMRGETIDGKKNGPWQSWFENGGIWSKNEFDHGVLNGSTEVYHKNGLLYYSGEYTKGEKSGEWSFYNEQGDLVKSVDFDKK